MVAFFTRNPPLYAAALALIAPDSLAPDVLVDASRIAIVALLPLGFFAVGAALAEEAEEGTIPVPPPLDAAVAAAVALRLVVAPGAAPLDRPAADRPPGPLPAARRDALRHQHDDRHPRLRARPADLRRRGGLVDRDRDRGRRGLAGVLNDLRAPAAPLHACFGAKAPPYLEPPAGPPRR